VGGKAFQPPDGEEDEMPWVYSGLTVLIGLFFYWLRTNHRAWYGFSEILVAFGLLYVTYFPHGGEVLLTVDYVPPTILDTLTSRAVPFFASVYAFVRGWDNIVEGLREPNI
jgi:hypothetical protein